MLIGRETERRVIERLVAGARVGASGVLLITGEPGIGKTALVAEAATLAAGLHVLRARGTEAERDLPFGALHQLLRPALGELPRIPAPQREALAAALALDQSEAPGTGRVVGNGPGVSPEERFAVGAATLSLVCRYAERVPVALLVDDAQLLDLPSAEAIAFAARRLLADPIMLVVAARADEAHPLAQAELPELRLSGVGLGAAQELMAGMPVDLVASLHRTVAGNPLALIELARDPEQLQRIPPGVPVPVPALLADAFAARANRLSGQAQTALLVASVDDGELGVVARACVELGVDIAVLAEGERASLVKLRDGRVEFRHPLVRSAIYTGAEPVLRRAVHLAVANAVQDDDRRAWHLSETVLGTDDAVAAALELAGDHAVARGAHAVAATAFERSARLTGTPNARALRLVAAGQAAWFAGLPERADSLLNEALTFDPPAQVRTHADELRGDIAVKCGSPARARDILVAAAASTAEPEAAVGLLSDVINACFRLGDAAGALGAAEQLTELLRRVDRPSTRVIGLLASGVAKVLAGRGGTDEIRQAVALAPSVALDRDRRRQIWMMLAPMFLRETGTGRALIEETMRERRDQVAVGVLPAVLFLLARDDATTDRWADAATAYDEGVRLSRETGQTTEFAINLAGLAWLSAHQGREQECRAGAAEAMAICAERQIHLGTLWSLFALGDLELGKGDPQAALPHYERLAEVLTSLGVLDPDLSPAPELVEVYLRLGRAGDAAAAARAFAVRAEEKGQPWAQARAARAIGLVEEDESEFQRALEWHARTLDVFEAARTRLVYGAWLRRTRRRVDARKQLREAVAAFDKLGAPGWADQAAAELKATGETARRRQPSTADDLTPQERQIALLLADGQSIRSVAARLFLSPKTVEYHLRKVYTKLGIHSRPELADILEKL
ncbi:helix-turn-helix transcriptional regulator [Kribbella sp. CA-293567]|uniref:helix-turn-helix transcriptional regulator n=1 Tax=Kribbella sp. CA-293567 TaxID=3002436 RepID=UPI0022DE4383|nr:LuxR family transcriptional regulator [Kribbella sp. CA-293567]WBQ06946.1 AAA family ATPase [Kribbella sp. CA-293567]